MKISGFLKDRITEFIFAAAALAAMLLFLYAFHVSAILMILIAGIFILCISGCAVWDFMRKKDFYDRLQNSISSLDQKYLASAVIHEPGFYEGMILYDTICTMGKAMTEQVSDSRRSVNDFREYVEMWVHEAKLPISSLLLKQYNMILPSGDAKASTPGQPIGEDEIRRIRHQLMKLDAYTDQILYFTRSEVAEKDFLIRECMLSRIFAAAASRLREELQENDFDIRTDHLNIPILTDGKWLEFIICQLISNSIKYRARGRRPELSVYARKYPERTDLHVYDNGIGIPQQDLPRIFEKSFTGENGRIGEKSTGMGLYITGKLCEKLGHRISAASVPGEYTEFTLSFAKNDFLRLS